MKQDSKPNPGVEIFHKLSLKEEFGKDLIEARKVLGIPERGFKEQVERLNWYEQPHDSLLLIDMWLKLRKKHKIPLAHMLALEDYLFFDRAGAITQQIPEPALILPPAHTLDEDDPDMEEFYSRNDEPYVKLIIPGSSTKSDILDFLRENWSRVEDVLKQQGWTRPRRIRKTEEENRKRDKRIKELWRKTKKELGNEDAHYKDLLIQKILKQEGFGDVNEGYIRKVGR